MKKAHDQGFTLIELLTVVAIIGILAGTMLSGFTVYRSSASYAVAASAFHHARNALEVALSDPDNLPGAVGLTSQQGPGPVGAGLRSILPGMQLPRETKVSLAYDPGCIADNCTESLITVRHCNAREYVTWTRAGDGVEILLEHVAGIGC